MSKFILVLVGLISINVHADEWLCRSQSAVKQGSSTITTCGIGDATDERTSRDLARENAITEFRKLCSVSADCREFDYNVEPKRLECEQHDDGTVCYQAIQFEILNTKRKEIYLDMDDIEKQLATKRREVDLQERKINRLRELKAQSELSEKNEAKLQILQTNMNKAQGETIKLEEEADPNSSGYVYTHQLFKNSFKLSTSYWSTNFFKTNETNALLTLGYEYRPVKWFGFGVSYGFGTDLGSTDVKSENDTAKTGTPNTTSSQNGTTQIHDLSISGNLYVHKSWYLKGEAGYAHATQNVYSNTYGPLGTSTVNSSYQNSIDKHYVGGSIGYDSRNHEKGVGFFGEVGARETLGDGRVGMIGTIGFNFGF